MYNICNFVLFCFVDLLFILWKLYYFTYILSYICNRACIHTYMHAYVHLYIRVKELVDLIHCNLGSVVVTYTNTCQVTILF